MLIANKYLISAVAVLVMFVYLFFTEVLTRIDDTIAQYKQVIDKENTLLTPDEFLLKRSELQMEKKRLTEWAKNKYYDLEQNQGGLFSHVNTNARRNNVAVRSMTPQEAKTTGRSMIIPFTISISAKYHDTAKFINSIETGNIPITVRRAIIQSDIIGSTMLTVIIEGEAHLLSEL